MKCFTTMDGCFTGQYRLLKKDGGSLHEANRWSPQCTGWVKKARRLKGEGIDKSSFQDNLFWGPHSIPFSQEKKIHDCMCNYCNIKTWGILLLANYWTQLNTSGIKQQFSILLIWYSESSTPQTPGLFIDSPISINANFKALPTDPGYLRNMIRCFADKALLVKIQGNSSTKSWTISFGWTTDQTYRKQPRLGLCWK